MDQTVKILLKPLKSPLTHRRHRWTISAGHKLRTWLLTIFAKLMFLKANILTGRVADILPFFCRIHIAGVNFQGDTILPPSHFKIACSSVEVGYSQNVHTHRKIFLQIMLMYDKVTHEFDWQPPTIP